MRALVRASAAPASRRRPTSARVYRLRARLVAAKREGGRIDVAITDAEGGPTLVASFADPACRSAHGAAASKRPAQARKRLLAACGLPPETHFARLRGVATLTGTLDFAPAARPLLAPASGARLGAVLDAAVGRCTRARENPVTVAAAGDIACDPDDPAFRDARGTPIACRMGATADLLVGGNYSAVLPLGDLQYPDGDLTRFRRSYALTWGRVKALSRPVPGNHEYGTPRAAGYFRYFGGAAGPPGKGYYSYDLGAWHVVALNSNCGAVGGCHAGSPQERWLRADLAGNRNRCVLAYWHHPRFSSGLAGGDAGRRTTAFWRALHAAGADVVLNGHEHDYERFAPQTPAGEHDAHRGLRQFVVGTGGKRLLPWGSPDRHSEARQNTDFGVLELTLSATGYAWRFRPVTDGGFVDAGSARCHR